jgi:hypothetical protein
MDTSLENLFVPYEIAAELKNLGFDLRCFACFDKSTEYHVPFICGFDLSKCIDWNKEDGHTSVPTFQQAFKWFRDKHGLYVVNQPEFYTTGINFNWQILWYLPKEEWKYDEDDGHVIYVETGTGMYGDNAEYPTQEKADLGIIKKMIEIVKMGKKEYDRMVNHSAPFGLETNE